MSEILEEIDEVELDYYDEDSIFVEEEESELELELDNIAKDFFEKVKYDTKLINYYSSFSNFPYQVKKEIIINITIFVSCTLLFLYLILFVKYFSVALLFAELLVSFFTITSSYYTIKNIRSVSFTMFKGRIEDSINIGIRNKSIILKIVGTESNKIICVKYYDNKTLYLDQEVTVFLPNNATIKQSQYGPMVNHYITIIPTDEINIEEDLNEIQENNSGENITVKDYLNN